MTDKNITIARSMYYEFFALPLFFSEDSSKFYKWKEQLIYLKASPIDPSNSKDFEILESFSFDEFKIEQNSVLFDYSYANVPLTASFYNEGRDDGKMRLMVVNITRKSKFRRDTELCKDSEDFIGFIFYLMSSILRDEIGSNSFLSSELFASVINDFVDEFCELLKSSKRSKFYLHLANLMESFFSFERAVLGADAPKKERSLAKESISKNPSFTRENESKIKYDISGIEFYDNIE
ncbi:MAG: hypothetical protein GXZ15_03830 [Campylobacter sp.]|nr:hypothetical protein [Campylobacter sp.]